MKRFLVAILAVLYFTISTGMVMNIHYCMGKVRSVNVNLMAKNMCGCGKTKETKSCCKTEHKVLKVEDNHKASYAFYDFSEPIADLPVNKYVVNTPLSSVNNVLAYNTHSPPLLSQQPIYLLNCVFRI
jgi:hypothetical protein